MPSPTFLHPVSHCSRPSSQALSATEPLTGQGPIKSAASLCPVTLGLGADIPTLWQREKGASLCRVTSEAVGVELWSQKVWVEILALPLTSVTLGKVITS